jgi:membrane protease YdiL (CAAX protease family)
MFQDLAASFLVVLLVVGVPVLAWQTAHNQEIRTLPRTALYFSAALSEWILAALAVGVVLVAGPRFRDLGFRALPLKTFFSWAAILAALTIALLALLLFFERRGWWPEESPLVHLLIPATGREKLWAVLMVAPTAALCEELIYRGYLLAQLTRWSHSEIFAWATSSVAFGLTHVYQKWTGMLRAGALGALLAYPVVRYGSLYPSIAAHFLIDAAALAWLGPKFLKETKVAMSDDGIK